MNILLLNWRDVRHPKSGGAEQVSMEHVKRWAEHGHKVTWLTAMYDGAKKEEIFEGVRILRRLGSLTIYLYAPWYVLIHGNNYDVIVVKYDGTCLRQYVSVALEKVDACVACVLVL